MENTGKTAQTRPKTLLIDHHIRPRVCTLNILIMIVHCENHKQCVPDYRVLASSLIPTCQSPNHDYWMLASCPIKCLIPTGPKPQRMCTRLQDTSILSHQVSHSYWPRPKKIMCTRLQDISILSHQVSHSYQPQALVNHRHN